MLSPWYFAQLRFQPTMSSSPDLHVFTIIQTVGSTNPRLDFCHEREINKYSVSSPQAAGKMHYGLNEILVPVDDDDDQHRSNTCKCLLRSKLHDKFLFTAIVRREEVIAITMTRINTFFLLLCLIPSLSVNANPSSKPYIAYRTSPYDQDIEHRIDWSNLSKQLDVSNKITSYKSISKEQCPLQFTLGYSQRPHSPHGLAIRHPPVLHTIYPAPGKQVIYTTQYEHLDVLTPALLETPGQTITEALIQSADFPLLLESSSFHTSPIVHDVNGDGIQDAIVVDYDGGITVTGLIANPERYLHHTQIPRLFVRREWMQGRIDEILHRTVDEEGEADRTPSKRGGSKPHDPYHSYFEYFYSGSGPIKDDLLRGVTANMIHQESEQVDALMKRRSRRFENIKSEQKSQNDQGESDVREKEEDVEESRRRRRIHGDNERRLEEQHRLDNEEQHRENPENSDAHDTEESHRQGNLDTNAAGDAGKYMSRQGAHGHPKEWEVDGADNHFLDHVPDPNVAVDKVNGNANMEAHGNEDQIKVDHHDLNFDEHAADVDKDKGGSDTEDEVRQGGAIDDAFFTRDDDAAGNEELPGTDEYAADVDDPDYGRYHGAYDDYYGHDPAHDEYYDASNYIRLPPHVLADPVLVEIPRAYTDKKEMDDVLFIPVSYYFDEDEHEGFFSYKRFEHEDLGDQTEARRGSYVASALMAFVLGDSTRWTGQTHLDLSTDFTAPENATLVDEIQVMSDHSKMGAFALGTPTVADLNGDNSMEVLIGTSMGMVYAFDARHMFKRDNWPIQMPRPVESRILVEDVTGDTNLEVFVTDIGGNVACFSSQAKLIWHRNIIDALQLNEGEEIAASSPLSLGDVNGDGILDVVVSIDIEGLGFVLAFNAATGESLSHFPMELEKLTKEGEKEFVGDIHRKIAQPLLIDLHGDQSHIEKYIRRNGGQWRPKTKNWSHAPSGGSAPGLHIVQPFRDQLYIIEGGSGCTQSVAIGDQVTAMVQADDVHGTGRLDLVVATSSGKIITLESNSPWHALNTWTHGELRGRENAHAHGYSASQGIFVHDVSRGFMDILGIYVPVTFEIFDNRPNIQNEPNRRVYKVEIRDGTSSKRALWRGEYNQTGVYTERIYIRYGPGFYSLSVVLRTSHGLVYEDNFPVRYNIHFMEGLGVLLWLPLLLASAAILFCGSRKGSLEDDDLTEIRGSNSSLGILGRALPT
jgi:hypothetical protein